MPLGEGVGAVTLVDENQRRSKILCGKVGVEAFQLGGQQQSLVDDGPGGHAADVEVAPELFREAAHDEKFAFELSLTGEIASVDEKLADDGSRFTGLAPDELRPDRHLPPADDPAALIPDDLFDFRFRPEAAEKHGGGVAPRCGELFRQHPAEKGVGQRQQQPRPVSRFGIAPRRAPVHQAAQDGYALLHDPV